MSMTQVSVLLSDPSLMEKASTRLTPNGYRVMVDLFPTSGIPQAIPGKR